MSAPLPPTPYPPPSAVVRVRSFVTRVLWTAIPFGSLGMCGWVPAVHAARRRRSPLGWWWLAGLSASAVLEIVLVSVSPGKGNGPAETSAGAFAVTHIITASIYAWRWCGPDDPGPQWQPGPYAGYGGGWMPAGYESQPPTPYTLPTQPYSPPSVVPPVPAAAANDMAAEIQAELRELRGFLGGGDAR